MARYLPTRPGWYRNPDEPRSLRYWDGKSWTGRSRSQPAWAKRADPFELEDNELDRSVEGPVHPRELREPVTSGAWARDLFGPWRPRQSEGWRRGGGHPSRPMVPAGPQPADRLGPARRPLVVLAALVMVAAAVVVSSVAVMSPYETRGNPQLLDQAAQATFAAQASKECGAVLPTYRVVLTSSVDGPSISAAADQLDLLGQHLSDLPATGGLQALVVEWLQAWKNYTADQRHYANIIGPAGRLHGHPVLRQMPGSARLAASVAHQQADDQAVQADRESANLGLTACRLEQGQTA
jgi:Protein of unknown function (DUF2510)